MIIKKSIGGLQVFSLIWKHIRLRISICGLSEIEVWCPVPLCYLCKYHIIIKLKAQLSVQQWIRIN